ncbi:MAG: sulfite exporter TauE/SafE family protein, partial [Candidatus Omnitrophica bacterium]|nr:sulfite exporter TauE/SafE family protein [Candidatus Omnitrophota bacterium]
MIAGIVMGFLSGLLGIGGGVVIVPALVYIFSLTMKEAIGTSLFIMLFASLSGLLTHRQKGQVNLKLGLVLGVAGMAGAQLGGFSTTLISDLWLKRLFGILLLFCASRMLLQKKKGEREGNCKTTSLEFSRWKAV